MKRHLYTAAVAVMMAATASPLFAATPKDAADLSQWATAIPENIDGIRTYPLVDEDGELKVSEIVDFPGRSRDRIFTNIYETVQRNFDENAEAVDNLDVDSRKILLHRRVADPDAAGVAYSYSIALQMADNMLVFLVYDINISYREKGVVPLTRAIAKLNPRENRRHKELVEGFALSLGKYIKTLQDAVTQDKSDAVTHWDEIGRHEAVRGMNATEVIMALGMPDSERKTGQRTKWMYGNDNVVIFTDGIVTNVI